MTDATEKSQVNQASRQSACSRRGFMLWAGRGLCAAALGGTAWRVLGQEAQDPEFVQPPIRYGWQIRADKCRFCGRCAHACVREPSAVKAVNDQKMCSNCVVCYGHASDKTSEMVTGHGGKFRSRGNRVCPHDAVIRKNFSGGENGLFLYTIDPDRCMACGRCARACNEHGSKSMFLVIRPDLCLGCNDCAIARDCPAGAIERVPLDAACDLREETLLRDAQINGEAS